jgi:hypothetical protein
MNKRSIKKILLTLLLGCVAFVTRAQLGFNYSQYDIGVSTGFNQVFGDAKTSPFTQSVGFNITFNQTPFTNLIFEAQYGKLKGGDSVNSASKRQFTSTFSSYTLREQLQAGEFIDYSQSRVANALKNVYLSVGIGFFINQITSIKRTGIYGNLYGPGENDIREPFIPIRAGYEFKIYNQYDEPSVKFDIGYQYNIMFTDNVDGYKFGSANDVYTQFSIGVKFAVGGSVTSYRKQIHY